MRRCQNETSQASGHHDQQTSSGDVRPSWSSSAPVPSATHAPRAGSETAGLSSDAKYPKSVVGRPSMTLATTWWAAPMCCAHSFTVHEPHHGSAAVRAGRQRGHQARRLGADDVGEVDAHRSKVDRSVGRGLGIAGPQGQTRAPMNMTLRGS